MSLEFNTINGFDYFLCGNVEAKGQMDGQCIYYLSMKRLAEQSVDALADIKCPVVYICIDDWDNQLSPWPAKGLYRGDADFKGEAAQTLEALTQSVIPKIEEAEGIKCAVRAIAGYSLAGLFSVYAFANTSFFKNVASMSGSFWYEGWLDYLEAFHPDKTGSFAYFSLGSKERHAKEEILHTVQDNTDKTASILQSWGATVDNNLVPGGHFNNMVERVQAGLNALCDRGGAVTLSPFK